MYSAFSNAYQPKLIITEDQSHSLYIEELDETYHSTHGAINESKHVYIQNGLLKKIDELGRVNVLEVGFGTGLNALLTWIEANKFNKHIFYQTFEPFPISNELLHKINYADLLETSNLFNDIHNAPWNHIVELDHNFTIEKINKKLGERYIKNNFFDIIYFDAFAPNKQPEVWSYRNLQLCYNVLKKGGLFTTYSVQGSVKRSLKSLGFQVYKVPGPKGKREILQAIKP